MSVPEFIELTGYLPPGRHKCTWTAFLDRFTWNGHRHNLAMQLLDALLMLRSAGCNKVWINGSYTTDKELPGDVDVLWDALGVQPRKLDPLFRSEQPASRAERKKRYGGDYFAVYDDHLDGAMIRHFQTDRSDIPKGIVEVGLSSLPRQEYSS